MAKDMSKILIKIEDEAGWHSLIDSSEDKLVICDIHQDWCGPTEAIHPTMIRVFQDYDDADERVIIASVSIQKLGSELIQSSFPSECHINLSKNGCIPIFALYRFKSCSVVIGGVDAPALLQQISLNIPDKAKAVGAE
mmetsp:Transcript_17080/g.16421  ORF Transcript_17080/g.16421 Transcript_17080/m.16421 type:complete len:138 (-) Transcript_17080:324-737(-)